MTIQQLEYILSLDYHRHFIKAAEACGVTQPSLSMQIQKLEEELGFKIFDRTRQPLVPTAAGEKIIDQARIILREINKLKEIAHHNSYEPEGELKLGILPTISPYLIPLILPLLIKKYPKIKFVVVEKTTEELIQDLKKNKIDVGIMATPLEDINLFEQPIYYEEMMIYSEKEINHQPIDLKDILPQNQLWMLKDGHCFRSQVLALCEKNRLLSNMLSYEAGSIETLIRMVDMGGGFTIIPETFVQLLNEKQKNNVYKIINHPQREISLVTHRGYEKEILVNILKEEIMTKVELTKYNSERKKRKNLIPKFK